MAALTSLLLAYSNCAGNAKNEEQDNLASQSGTCGENLSASVRSPATIEQAVNLINQLPKPLAIDCFIRSLASPISIYAVNSPSSLQPAAGQDSPRIFIINKKLVLSVVPKGPGRMLMEMSQKVSATGSVKGELLFPLGSNIASDAPYSRILERTSGTSCRICHQNEGLYPSLNSSIAYQSDIVAPLDQVRVNRDYLKAQATFCNSTTDAYRCQMLRAIFIDRQAQDGYLP